MSLYYLSIKKIVIMFLIVMVLTPVISYADTVDRVYVCGKDVGIKMKNAGYVVALETQLGEKRVDRILSVALSLVATQNQTGFFNPGAPFKWCGIENAKPITVLGIEK